MDCVKNTDRSEYFKKYYEENKEKLRKYNREKQKKKRAEEKKKKQEVEKKFADALEDAEKYRKLMEILGMKNQQELS